jgi:hypothetical protein
MRTREAVAAVAGVAGAAATHGLDVAGALPGVHESAAVRGGMSPLATALWLALAALLAVLAARTRPVLLGAPAALLLSGVPELVVRHDPGAVVEPGAMAGALVQWLLLIALLALVVAVERGVARPLRVASLGAPVVPVAGGPFPRPPRPRLFSPAAPRAPPRTA